MMTLSEVERKYGSYVKNDPDDLRLVYAVYLGTKIVDWEKEKKAHKHVIWDYERMAAIDRAAADATANAEALFVKLGYLPKPKAGVGSVLRRGVPSPDDL